MRWNVSRGAAGLAALVVLLLPGCDEKTSVRTITLERDTPRPSQDVRLDATSADRFDMAAHGEMGGPAPGSGAMPAGGSRKPFTWDLPPGWAERPDPSGRRVGSFMVGGTPDGDGSIALLGGTGGGLEANVDRWRKQVGQPPLKPEEIEQLPKVSILGQPATLVEAEGTFTGMGDGAPRPNWKLLGAILELDVGQQQATVFVKLTGPKDLLDAEKAHFAELCESIKVAGHEEQPPEESPASPPQQPQPPEDAPPVTWSAPPDWKPLGPKPLRTVSFKVRGDTECYVSVLSNSGGGLETNLNRWRGQMGLPPLDAAGIAALAKVTVLGDSVPLFEATGTFADMAGEKHANWCMLGAIGQKGGSGVFVKMIGPQVEVEPERPRFVAFAGSLR